MVSDLGWSSPLLALAAGAALALSVGSAGWVARRRAAIPMVLGAGFIAFLGLAGYLSGSDGWEFTAVDSVIGALAGVGFGLSAMFLVRGLGAGPFSVAAPTTALVGIAVPHMIGLAFGQSPTAEGLSGILLAVGAIAILVRGEALPAGPAASEAPDGPTEPTASEASAGHEASAGPEASSEPTASEASAAPDAFAGPTASDAFAGTEASAGRSGAVRRDALAVEGLARGAVFAVMAGVAGGMGLALLHGTDASSGASPLLVASGAAVLSVGGLSAFTKKLVLASPRGRRSVRLLLTRLVPTMVAGGGAAASGVLYLEAVATGSVGFALGLGSTWAGFLWLLGVVVLREAVAGDRWLAVVMALVATVLLSIAVGRGSVARTADEGQRSRGYAPPSVGGELWPPSPNGGIGFPPSSGSASWEWDS